MKHISMGLLLAALTAAGLAGCAANGTSSSSTEASVSGASSGSMTSGSTGAAGANATSGTTGGVDARTAPVEGASAAQVPERR